MSERIYSAARFAAPVTLTALLLSLLPGAIVPKASLAAADRAARVDGLKQPVAPQNQPPKDPVKEADNAFRDLYNRITGFTNKNLSADEWEKLAMEARDWSQKDMRNAGFYLLAARCYTEAKKIDPAKEWLDTGKMVFKDGPTEQTPPANWKRKALLIETLYRFAAVFHNDPKVRASDIAREAKSYAAGLESDIAAGLRLAGDRRTDWEASASTYRGTVADARTAWEKSETVVAAGDPSSGTNAAKKTDFDLQAWFKTDPKKMGVWECGYVQLSAPTFVPFDERILSPEMKVVGGETTPGGALVWRVQGNRRPCIVFNNTEKPIPIALAVWTSEGENQPQKPEAIWQSGEIYLCPIAGKVSAAVAWKCPTAGKYKVTVQAAAEGTDVLIGGKRVEMAIYLVRGALSPRSLVAPKVLKQVRQPVEATLPGDQTMKVGERVYIIVDSQPNTAEVWARVRVTITPDSK